MHSLKGNKTSEESRCCKANPTLPFRFGHNTGQQLEAMMLKRSFRKQTKSLLQTKYIDMNKHFADVTTGRTMRDNF
jgi:hypothetical protein